MLQSMDAPLAACVGLAALLVARQNNGWLGSMVAVAALIAGAAVHFAKFL